MLWSTPFFKEHCWPCLLTIILSPFTSNSKTASVIMIFIPLIQTYTRMFLIWFLPLLLHFFSSREIKLLQPKATLFLKELPQFKPYALVTHLKCLECSSVHISSLVQTWGLSHILTLLIYTIDTKNLPRFKGLPFTMCVCICPTLQHFPVALSPYYKIPMLLCPCVASFSSSFLSLFYINWVTHMYFLPVVPSIRYLLTFVSTKTPLFWEWRTLVPFTSSFMTHQDLSQPHGVPGTGLCSFSLVSFTYVSWFSQLPA